MNLLAARRGDEGSTGFVRLRACNTAAGLRACLTWEASLGPTLHTLYPPFRNYYAINPSKLFGAMITRISRNLARNNSSDIFWRNDKMAIAQIDSWKHATKTV